MERYRSIGGRGCILAALVLACTTLGKSQPRAIDTAKSVLTVHVYKEGALAAFGHDHEITAPVASGNVDVQGRKVELEVSAAALRVVDPKASDKDRAQIQSTMLGPEVLDTGNFKDIRFHSTGAEAAGAGAWKVSGDLTIHGQTRPISLEVHEKEGRYTGSCRVTLTSFGIKPVKVAGGAVRVKDQIQIDFQIQLQ